MKIDFRKYFDTVVILNLVNEKKKRENMEMQCKEIFAPESPYSFHTSVIFPWNEVIKEGFNNSLNGKFKTKGEVGCAMEHYAIIKKAYETGKNSILVMEDDIAWLKDTEYIQKCLDNVPKNWDILMMSSFLGQVGQTLSAQKHPDSEIINDYWFIPFWPGWCTACYALNRKGMLYYLKSQETFFQVADMPLYNALKFQENKQYINTYFSYKPLAIQKDLYYTSSIRNKEDILYKKKMNLYEKEVDEHDYFSFE